MTTELRRHPRVPLHARVPLAFSLVDASNSGSSDRVGSGTLANLSLKGCQVHSDESVEKGDHMSVRVHISHRDVPVCIEMATVRWTKGHAFGLEFISLWPADETVLREFIDMASTHRRAS